MKKALGRGATKRRASGQSRRRPRYWFWALLGLVVMAIIWSSSARQNTEPALPRQRLMQIIAHHPEAAIRQRLRQLMTRDSVKVEFRAVNSVHGVAAFSVTLPDTLPGSTPILGVADQVLQPGSRVSRCQIESALWHEYQHLAQLFESRSSRILFVTTPRIPQWTDIRQLFIDEAEAYRMQFAYDAKHRCNPGYDLMPAELRTAYATGGVYGLHQILAERMTNPPLQEFRPLLLVVADSLSAIYRQ